MIKWKRKPSGLCPVQAEGYFLGYYFYFRSRHSIAEIEFAKTEADWYKDNLNAQYILWTTKEQEAAGWLNHYFCRVLVWIGCIKFLFKKDKSKVINQ